MSAEAHTIDYRETLIQLRTIRKRLIEYDEAVDRKRTWRPSEKAMAKAAYNQEIAALNKAIALIGSVT